MSALSCSEAFSGSSDKAICETRLTASGNELWKLATPDFRKGGLRGQGRRQKKANDVALYQRIISLREVV